MLWQVDGYERETGLPKSIQVEAKDERSAIIAGAEAGLVIERVQCYETWLDTLIDGAAGHMKLARDRVFRLSFKAKTIVVICVAVLVGGYLSNNYLDSRPYKLPTMQQVKAELNAWDLKPVEEIVRGRPVTTVRITADASKPGRSIRLIMDEENRPIGMVANAFETRLGTVTSLGDTRWKGAAERIRTRFDDPEAEDADAYVVADFAEKYALFVGSGLPLYPDDIRQAAKRSNLTLYQDKLDTTRRGQEELRLAYKNKGIFVEYIRVTSMTGDGRPSYRSHLWIIRNWD